MEIKWHSPDLKAAKRYPEGYSRKMWTAQIKVNDNLLSSSENLLLRQKDIHIFH